MADSGTSPSGALSSPWTSSSTGSASAVSSSTASSSSSASASASAPSEDAAEPPRSRLYRVAVTLVEQSPLLPPLIDMSARAQHQQQQQRHRAASDCSSPDAPPCCSGLCGRVLSYLPPDRLVIADGVALNVFSLSRPTPLKAKRAEPDVRQPAAAGSVPSLQSCCPLLVSWPLKAPTQLLHLHDGRVCTKAAGEKVIRLYSALPPLSHAASLPALAASASPSLLHLRHERPSPVVSALLSLDAHRLLVGFADGALQLYNSRTGARYAVSTGSGILALIPVSPAFAASASTSSIIVSSRALAVAASSSASSSSASPSASHVLTYTVDRTFRLVDLQLGRIARYIGRIPFATRVYSLDADCRVAVTGEHSVFFYRLDTWTCEVTLSHHEEMRQEAAAAAGSGSGSSASHPPGSQDWQEEKKDDADADSSGWLPSSLHGASPLVALPPPPRQPTFVCALWSPFVVATGNSAGFLHVHSAQPSSPQRLLCTASAHACAVCHLLYAREGRIVSCAVDGEVRLWQLETQRTDPAGKSRWRGVTGEESEPAAEEEEEASSWRLRLLCEYAVQDSHCWCGSVLFLAGC